MKVLPRPKIPEERLLDLMVYVPLGLALTIAEAVPELARRGRARVEPQVRVARMVGQMAVKQGYRQVARLATTRFGSGRPPWAPASAGPGPGRQAAADGPAPSSTEAPSPASRSAARAPGVGAADLAIPSYDSLSAHQVVQRLEGLSREEVAAVRDYERATRGRRTIISRAEQLLS